MEKLAQKVGRREKLAQKVGRREIYSRVPPPHHMFRSLRAMEFIRTIDLGDNHLLKLHCTLLCLHNSVSIAFGFLAWL